MYKLLFFGLTKLGGVGIYWHLNHSEFKHLDSASDSVYNQTSECIFATDPVFKENFKSKSSTIH